MSDRLGEENPYGTRLLKRITNSIAPKKCVTNETLLTPWAEISIKGRKFIKCHTETVSRQWSTDLRDKSNHFFIWCVSNLIFLNLWDDSNQLAQLFLWRSFSRFYSTSQDLFALQLSPLHKYTETIRKGNYKFLGDLRMRHDATFFFSNHN